MGRSVIWAWRRVDHVNGGSDRGEGADEGTPARVVERSVTGGFVVRIHGSARRARAFRGREDRHRSLAR
jgi:hypothetical protein